MATDNNKKVVTSDNMQADRQYLVDSRINRLIMMLLFGGGLLVASVLLFLAAYGKTGRYTNPDTTQYEASLNAAATMLEGGAVAPDNAERVTLPIDTAIRATADKGLSTITASLKQVGTPPAPVAEPVVTTETTVVETVVEEVVVEEPVETNTIAVDTATMGATAATASVVAAGAAVAATPADTSSETVLTEVVTTESVTGTVEAQTAVQPVVVETTTVETTTTVVEAAPVVETQVIENQAVTTTTNTINTITSSSTDSMVLGVSPGIVASTVTMASGLKVEVNRDVYSACVSCHQSNGEGIITVFPPLAEHAAKLFNADRDYLANVVLYGLQGTIVVDGLSYNQPMRGYPELSDADIAGVLNYVLTTWGNESLLAEDFRPYEAKDITGLRGQNLSPELIQTMRTTLTLE